MQKKTLISHGAIRQFVETRAGHPAVRAQRMSEGGLAPRLALRFSGQRPEGLNPCSWTAWLAEFDRQRLALQVSPGAPDIVEIVPRPTT